MVNATLTVPHTLQASKARAWAAWMNDNLQIQSASETPLPFC